ncbi:MAG TPA: hypothetical protein DHV08_02805 [Rhodocyclaceae bacterium]|nr:MAG: hypothetical protein AUK49_00830 [Betaproteobacteria bacterium CG2_30_68_42]PIV73998.1 MAG: hypothetical protein COW56_05715 [Rhodocyclales bacterium CG17_big_fil_post_rev_8_21_14_2_50_68_7]PIX73892.1 MAG: hypothetical protein COZ38_12325 [Rhodocyclales bacterium CG_4_10_14_3_um_filter_68_10]PJA56365.1 MAG: hypothetical protein CO164_13750 [Rhodocyclales bacterium CG_4_9_14_3_um_filter_68_10]HCX32575.1 hypothetical protein [Rhodocyclaceae bacterium]
MVVAFESKGIEEEELAARVEALSGAPPMAALREAAAWLREAAEAPEAARREAAIRRLDDAAQSHARTLAREFLTMAPVPEQEELDLWRTNRDFWAQLGAAYYACFGEAERRPLPADALGRIELARLTLRMMRAYAARLKWDQFRYWPPSLAVWQIVGHAYLYADEQGFARREVSAYHGEHPSTVEQEYLRALVFQVSATDALLPFEIEIAERLIAAFLPLFSLSRTRTGASNYWVDPSERRPPARVAEALPENPTLRYLSASSAHEALERLRASLEQGSIPPNLELARYPSPRILTPVVEHLLGHWGPSPPARAHDRHRVQSEAGAVIGLPAIARMLGRPEDAAGAMRWVVENVSQGGLSARLPLSEADILPIGTVIGLRPAGGDNWLAGVVRRFARVSAEAGIAGIETLSRHPLAVEVGAADPLRGALLLDAPDEGETVRLIVPSPAFDPGEELGCILAGARLRLRVLDVLEALGAGELVLASCRVVPGAESE